MITEDTTIYDLESEVMELRTQLERLKDRNESSVNTVTEITFQQTKKHRKRNTSSKKRKIEILNKDETLIDNRGDNIQRESTVNNGIQANIFENPGHHFMDDSDKISSLGEKPFEDSIRDTLDFVTEDNDVPLELEYLVESPFYFENYYPVSPIPDSINVVTDNELESREGETHDDFFGNSGYQELGLKPLEFNSCDSPVVDNFDQDNLEMVTEFLNNESFGLNCSGNGGNDIETKDKFNIMDIGNQMEMKSGELREEFVESDLIMALKNKPGDSGMKDEVMENKNEKVVKDNHNDNVTECTLPKDREVRKSILGNLCHELKLNEFEKHELKHGTKRSFSSFFNDPKIETRKRILKTLMDSSINLDDLATTELRQTIKSLEQHFFYRRYCNTAQPEMDQYDSKG